MSILVIELVPEGIVFAADKNITFTDTFGGEQYERQEPGLKILKWPNNKGLIGYVGCAYVSGRYMSEWLRDFIEENSDFTDSRKVANDLKNKIEIEFNKVVSPQQTIIEFCVFENDDGYTIPKMWHITNVPGLDAINGYLPAVKSFSCTEEISGNHLKDVPREKIKEQLSNWAKNGQPFWFHQGINLAIFNQIEQKLKEALNNLQHIGMIPKPIQLSEWENHAKFWVLGYGAFFDSFSAPGEKYVGGGVDVLSIPWPE